MKFKILLLTVSMVMAVNLGYACTCGAEDSPRIRFDRATAIFAGTVIGINDKAVKLRRARAYKGNVEKEILITRSGQETTCDIFFGKGDKYLVYANEVKLDEKPMLVTDVCAGTGRYANRKEDIKYLETPEPSPNFGELVPPKDQQARSKYKRKTKKQ